jgi:hypothetical protein
MVRVKVLEVADPMSEDTTAWRPPWFMEAGSGLMDFVATRTSLLLELRG